MSAPPAAAAVDKIVRQRIHDSLYWKQYCFSLNAASLCDRAAELTEVGGLFANSRPTPFLCLTYKLALIQPEREIVEELLNQPHFKYLTAIAAVYIRLFYSPKDIYLLLEPLLADYRKLRWQGRTELELKHMDELIDMLLRETRVFDLALPRMPSRVQLEDRGLPLREPLLPEALTP